MKRRTKRRRRKRKKRKTQKNAHTHQIQTARKLLHGGRPRARSLGDPSTRRSAQRSPDAATVPDKNRRGKINHRGIGSMAGGGSESGVKGQGRRRRSRHRRSRGEASRGNTHRRGYHHPHPVVVPRQRMLIWRPAGRERGGRGKTGPATPPRIPPISIPIISGGGQTWA